MKKHFYLFLAAIIVISSRFTILAQAQSNPFPIGIIAGFNAYHQESEIPDLLKPIADLGANLVAYPLIKGSNPNDETRRYNYIFAANAYSKYDFVHWYSGGYWKTWYPKTAVLGIGDTSITLLCNSVSAEGDAASPAVYNSSNYIVTGPSYKQDFRYETSKRNYAVYEDQTPGTPYLVNYEVAFTMKKGNSVNAGDNTKPDKICQISVWLKQDTAEYPTMVLSQDIGVDELTTNEYSKIVLTDPTKVPPAPNNSYNYYNSITIKYAKSLSNQIIHTPLGRPVIQEIKEENTAVEFRVKWYGHAELLVKQIDVYDVIIGKYIQDRSNNSQNEVKRRIREYLTSDSCHYGTYNNITAWGGLDEPWTVDSYQPYQYVDEIINAIKNDPTIAASSKNAVKPILSTFCPFDAPNNNYVGGNKFPMWVQYAKPEILLFDFYPINKEVWDDGSQTASIPKVIGQYNVLRGLLADAHNAINQTGSVTSKFYYLGQAHSYISSGNDHSGDLTHQPTVEQFKYSGNVGISLLPRHVH